MYQYKSRSYNQVHHKQIVKMHQYQHKITEYPTLLHQPRLS